MSSEALILIEVAHVQEITEEIPAAKELFTKASDILGYDLLQLCLEGVTHCPLPQS